MNRIIEWFSDPGRAAFSALIVSVVGVLVSILAFCSSHRTRNRLVKIEKAREKDRLTEKAKANLTAVIHKEQVKARAWSYTLEIKNSGRGTARNVVVKAIGDHKFASKVPTSIPEIGPNAAHAIVLNTGLLGTQDPLTVEITWTDDSGQPGCHRTTVTL